MRCAGASVCLVCVADVPVNRSADSAGMAPVCYHRGQPGLDLRPYTNVASIYRRLVPCPSCVWSRYPYTTVRLESLSLHHCAAHRAHAHAAVPGICAAANERTGLVSCNAHSTAAHTVLTHAMHMCAPPCRYLYACRAHLAQIWPMKSSR